MGDYKIKTTLNKNFKPMTFRVGGKPHYQIFVELESDKDKELKKVERVEYILHPTFKDRTRISTDRGQNFQIELRAWGRFTLRAKLYLTDGTVEEFTQDMKDNWHVSYM